MTVDRTEVERIAQLARLSLTDDEADRLVSEMNQILEHAMHLRRSAETESNGREGVRDDDTTASGSRPTAELPVDALHRDLTSFAPHVVDGFFVVPPPPGVSADAGNAGGSEGGDA